MAKEKPGAKAPPANNKKSPPPRKGRFGFFMTAILMGVSLLFIMPTFVLVMVGLIPTFVALMTDDDPEKSTSITIGSLNVIGTLPFVIDLWVRGQTIGTAFDIMSQAMTWIVIFGAAAIGKLIIFVVPQATATISLATAERRHKMLNDHLESLKSAWGTDVGTTKPLNSLRPKE